MMQTMRRHLGAWVAAALLAACGGGGGDAEPALSAAPSGPPATAATMGSTATDAVDAAKASVAAADGVAARQGALSGLTVLGAPVAGSPGGLAFAALVQGAGMKQAQAVSTDACTDFLASPCTGSVTTDTNLAANATSVKRGDYIEGTFNALSGSLFGTPLSLSGKLRIEFLTAFNLNASSPAGVQLRLVFTAFSGSFAGYVIGPVSETVDLVFDAQGTPTFVVQGASFSVLSTVNVTGPGSYTIGSLSARVGYGSTQGYVDVRLTNWFSSAGRPNAGSFSRVSAGAASASVTVVSAGSTTVVYDVFITGAAPGSSASFRVTATYPTGGGAPSYSAVAG